MSNEQDEQFTGNTFSTAKPLPEPKQLPNESNVRIFRRFTPVEIANVAHDPEAVRRLVEADD